MKTIDEEYNDFWKEIIEIDGEINKEQLKKELYDFGQLITNIGRVYCHITRGAISKPLTDVDIVIQVAEECIEKDIEEAIKEFEELQGRKCENCIHADMLNESSGICTNIDYSTYGIGIDNEFYCNKFEPKEHK